MSNVRKSSNPASARSKTYCLDQAKAQGKPRIMPRFNAYLGNVCRFMMALYIMLGFTPAPVHATSIQTSIIPNANFSSTLGLAIASDGAFWMTSDLVHIFDGTITFTRYGDGAVSTYTIRDPRTVYVPPSSTTFVSGFALAPDGNFWVTSYSNNFVDYYITKMNPLNGALIPVQTRVVSGPRAIKTELEIPTSIKNGPDGDFFVILRDGSIGRLTTNGDIARYQLDAQAQDVLVGPDGAMWAHDGRKFYRISAQGEKTTYVLPTSAPGIEEKDYIFGPGGGLPGQSAVGPDGAIWFPLLALGQRQGLTIYSGVGRMTVDGQITYYPMANALVRKVISAHGDLWFAETIVTAQNNDGFPFGYDAIGRITTDGASTSYKLSDKNTIFSNLALGLDGNIYFAAGNAIGSISQIDDTVTPKYQLSQSLILPGASPTGSQGFLRFHNSASIKGQVTVYLYDAVTGEQVVKWTSSDVLPGTTQQFPVSELEKQDAAYTPGKHKLYSAHINPGFLGSFQYVLWQPQAGGITNLTSCNDGTAQNLGRLIDVHSSLQTAYPSSIGVTNTGITKQAITLNVVDAQTGGQIGSYVTDQIPPFGQVLVSISDMEKHMNVTPAPGHIYYNIVSQGALNVSLQHLVTNSIAGGIISDMTSNFRLLPGS